HEAQREALGEQGPIERGGLLHGGDARTDGALGEVAHGAAEQLFFLGERGEGGTGDGVGHQRPNLAPRLGPGAEPAGACRSTTERRGRFVQRSFTRRTNLSPDHTSSTAATFTATRPCASPIARITSSVRSVATPHARLGHELHNMPAGASARSSARNRRASSRFSG